MAAFVQLKIIVIMTSKAKYNYNTNGSNVKEEHDDDRL
jgi:hypothetical protein